MSAQAAASGEDTRCGGNAPTYLDCVQSLVEIGDDVLHILNAHRNPHHAVGNTNLFSSLLAHGCVGHGRRMRNQCLHSAERLCKRAKRELLSAACWRSSESRFKADHGPEAAHLSPGKFVLRMIWEPRIEDFLHLPMLGEEISDQSAVAIVLLHAYSNGLTPRSTSQASNGEKYRSCCLLHIAELLGLLGSGAQDYTPEAVAVVIQNLGCRVHN